MAHPLVRFLRVCVIGGAAPLLAGSFAAQAWGQDPTFREIDVNNVATLISNNGEIGNDPRTSGPFGFFPNGTPNNYVFGSALWIGGIVNGTKQVAAIRDPRGGNESIPGRVDGSGGGDVLCSDIRTELERFYPESPVFGGQSFIDPTTGLPRVYSQKDCVVIYRDGNHFEEVKTPMGVQIVQRSMAFTFSALNQVVFFVWDLTNAGGNDIQDAFIGVEADMDIAVSAGEAGDDRCSAIPVVPPGPNNETIETLATNLGICWDSDFNSPGFDPNRPGFVGFTFFQGPVNDVGDTLGLTLFTETTNAGGFQPDPTSDSDKYDLMAGIPPRQPAISNEPDDVRFLQVSGPFTFAPGTTQRVAAGLVFANAIEGLTELVTSGDRCFPPPLNTPCELPDPQDPALAEIIRVQRAAQIIFDANFLAPGPPPKPDVTLIPGDKQVTIVFSDVSGARDPFFDVTSDPTSPAFDTLFREFDFEGVYIVRSTSGLLADPIDTLAIFDLRNEISTIDDTTFQTFAIGDSFVTLATSITRIVNLPNEGLQFSVVDRDVINGITYFYDVVPFDFNPNVLTSGTPDISLSAGISFPAAQSVKPRSDASSFVPADISFNPLKADGTVCNQDEPTATLDVNTGKYTDFVDCSNAVLVTDLSGVRGLELPAGNFFLEIDSLTIDHTGDYDLAVFGGYNLAFTLGNRAWYHWEDETGAPTNVISPSSGFFDQDFSFFHSAQTGPLPFTIDAAPDIPGPDLSLILTVGSDFSEIEDLEVNGQSLHLEELGGTHFGEARPHGIEGSSLADTVVIGNARGISNAREYSHAGNYAQGGTSYELTWEVTGSTYSGTLRKLPGGEVVPEGGQPRGPENPNTPADFVVGYNWGFIGPGAPEDVRGTAFPVAGPLANEITLNTGDSFTLMVPGQSVNITGIQDLPENGDTWRLLIDTGSQRSTFGRDGSHAVEDSSGNFPGAPYHYHDVNDGGDSPSFDRGIVNVYPGARWRLAVAPASNDPANADLSQIKTVPNPYVANSVWDFSQDNQRVEFINLPPECTIRIYTISGNLVRVIEHTNLSGTEVWDLRTRFNLKAASGTYYWHVTTPDGDTRLGLMSIIQNSTGAS